VRKDETPSTRRSCERRGSYAAADGMGTLRDICFNGDCGKWQSACHRASSMDHAVWVPAFAGTTVGERRGPTTRRPCKRRGPYAAAAGMGTQRDVGFKGHGRRWQSVRHRASSIDQAVWVPAFARTTCVPYSQFSAPPFWYSITRVSKKFFSFFKSIASDIQGNGFSVSSNTRCSPSCAQRRLAMKCM
jgi:hypothetical protein